MRPLRAAERTARAVRVDHPRPLLEGGADHGAGQNHAGVVDHRVEPPELGHGGRHRLLGLLLVGHVGGDREGGAAVRLDRGGELVGGDHAANGHAIGQPLGEDDDIRLAAREPFVRGVFRQSLRRCAHGIRA